MRPLRGREDNKGLHCRPLSLVRRLVERLWAVGHCRSRRQPLCLPGRGHGSIVVSEQPGEQHLGVTELGQIAHARGV